MTLGTLQQTQVMSAWLPEWSASFAFHAIMLRKRGVGCGTRPQAGPSWGSGVCSHDP